MLLGLESDECGGCPAPAATHAVDRSRIGNRPVSGRAPALWPRSKFHAQELPVVLSPPSAVPARRIPSGPIASVWTSSCDHHLGTTTSPSGHFHPDRSSLRALVPKDGPCPVMLMQSRCFWACRRRQLRRWIASRAGRSDRWLRRVPPSGPGQSPAPLRPSGLAGCFGSGRNHNRPTETDKDPAAMSDGRVFVGTGSGGLVVELTDPKQPASRPGPEVRYVWGLAEGPEGALRSHRSDRPALEAIRREWRLEARLRQPPETPALRRGCAGRVRLRRERRRRLDLSDRAGWRGGGPLRCAAGRSPHAGDRS